MPACATCHVNMDGQINTEGGSAPEHGDLTFCASCGSFNVFELHTSGGRIKLVCAKPTKKQMAEIMADHRCVTLLSQWSQWNRQQRATN